MEPGNPRRPAPFVQRSAGGQRPPLWAIHARTPPRQPLLGRFWEEETTARLITPPPNLPQSKSTGTGRLKAGHAQRTLFPGPGSEPLTPSQGLCCLWGPDRNLERRTHLSPVGLAVLSLLGKTEACSLFLYSLLLVPHSFAGVCSCLTHLLHEALPGYL